MLKCKMAAQTQLRKQPELLKTNSKYPKCKIQQ